MKRFWLFFVLVACVVSAVFAWLWSSQGVGNRFENVADKETLGLEHQSPRVEQTELRETSQRANVQTEEIGANAEQETSAEDGKQDIYAKPPKMATDASELQFSTIEATLDELARLYAIEWDRLLSEGFDGDTITQVNRIVRDDIFKQGMHPELWRSMGFFQIGEMYDASSPALLARAGRIPMTWLLNIVELPNGELYKIKEPHTKVIIRYKKRLHVEELERWKREEQELLERIEDGEASLEAQLAVVRLNIEIQSKAFTKREGSVTWGSEDHPDFKVVVLDLGILED